MYQREHVGTHRVLEMPGVGGQQRTEPAGGRVADDDVELADGFPDKFHHAINVFLFADVRLDDVGGKLQGPW